MLFNSIEFLFFIIIVYGLYLNLGHRGQNRVLLIGSYVFYGAWDWRFLSLIIFSTVLDFFCGLKIYESKNKTVRKLFLYTSVGVNLGMLCLFKYFNFFIESFQSLLWNFGHTGDPIYLNIILPMGISFYTFQTMSYTIDIHRKQLKPTTRFWDFALFVSFFPQLVAGPIERAKRLLPQILSPRTVTWNKFTEGCYLIGWGLFQKVFVADNLAKIVNPFFAGDAPYNGSEALIAAYAFTFQIYGDFAGYSNVARGLGKIMGFDIMINFNMPFFATNIQDYWNRWHISLSSWLRDYLYIPLFRWLRMVKGNMRLYLALLITMTVIGFWHGAAWTFVLFGVYYGVLLILYVMIRTRCQGWIQPKSQWGQNLWYFARNVFLFHLVVIGMTIFRAQSVGQVGDILWAVVTRFEVMNSTVFMLTKFAYFTAVLLLVQVFQFFKGDLMAVYKANPVLKTFFYLCCLTLFIMQGVTSGNEFIYFQF